MIMNKTRIYSAKRIAKVARYRKEIDNNPDWLALEKDLAGILREDFRLDEFWDDTMEGINCHEMQLLFREGDKIAPKKIVEIGSRAGCSSIILGALAKKHEGYVYCIDPNHHQLWMPNIEKYGVDAHCIQTSARSPWIEWRWDIDIAFIDGDHDFVPCLVDCYFWTRFVRPGGLVILHDINIRDGVKQTLEVIEATFPLEKIAINNHGAGMVAYRKLKVS
jgi:precorrin-6B methylase 2